MIVQDKNKITLYRSLDELAKSNVLVGRKNGLVVGIDELTIDELRTYIEKANTCDYLQQRINKAIEYINKYKNQNWYIESRFTEELLNILRGNNEN